MENIFTPYKTLLYYDGPQLFLARDVDGGSLLCMAIEGKSDDKNDYVAIPISNDRFNALVQGDIDLREAYIQSESGKWYHVSVNENGELIGTAFQLDGLDERYLPDAGFDFVALGVTGEEIK